MNTRFPFTRLMAFASVLALALGAALPAQDPTDPQDEGAVNPADLARQIRRNMLKIEEDLGKIGTHDPSRGEQVRKDIDKLLEGMKGRQDQVIKDIDDIVKQLKTSNCNSGKQGSSDSNQNQKQSRKRDRNQSDQKSGKPRDGNKPEQGKDKKPGQQPPKGNGEENNNQKDRDSGENVEGDPQDRPGPEKATHINLNEIWGNLPPELRQKLVDRNFDDFTPEYKAQIDEYFKKTGSAPKKN
jgi:hypothetical protein